jgi:hypothetical protein
MILMTVVRSFGKSGNCLYKVSGRFECICRLLLVLLFIALLFVLAIGCPVSCETSCKGWQHLKKECDFCGGFDKDDCDALIGTGGGDAALPVAHETIAVSANVFYTFDDILMTFSNIF